MACCTKGEHEEVKHVLTNLITQLCKNGVKYSDKLHIEGLVGVTVDHSDVFFVRISETIEKPQKTSGNEETFSGRSAMRNYRPQTHRQSTFSTGSSKRAATESPYTHGKRSGTPDRTNSSVYCLNQSPIIRKSLETKVKPEVVELDDDYETEETPPPTNNLIPLPVQEIPAKEVSIPSRDNENNMTIPQFADVPSELPGNVTVIAPSDSNLDDTQAMRQGYQVQEPDLSPELHSPAKRLCLEQSPRQPDSAVYVGQWPHLAAETRTVPTRPTSFSSPAAVVMPEMQSGSPRGFKNPRNNTMCQPVRDVLEHSLARPILGEAQEVTAFRLFWRGQDTITGWKNIIYNRMELDAVVAEYPGVSFFISAITATARDPKTTFSNNDARLRAYPALGYWVVTRDPSFDRHILMKKLAEVAESAELKTMLQCDGEKVNEVGALNLIVKDYGKGYVQQRIKESAGEDHPTIRFILKEEHFEEKLLEAVDLLSGVGCPVSLEKVEVDSFDIENEGASDLAAEEKDMEQTGSENENEKETKPIPIPIPIEETNLTE